tara:strand:- start:6553 stop:7185 length:633 start_codon:yes stop_codon:yes gene_type:complete
MDIIKVYKNSKYYNIAINILKDKYDKKKRGEQYWKKRYQKSKLNYIGFLLKVESEFVGFLGFLGNKKIIGLSVWYVEPKYRKYSILFVSEVLIYEKNKSIVNSSPNPTALKVFKTLFKFNFKLEYIGLPRNIFGVSKIDYNQMYFGEKLIVNYNENISLIQLIYLTLRYKKICLALVKNSNSLFLKKNINILYRNISYHFPMSVNGDVYE